jgi:nitrite reductase/ring-hydroxylating ferredoxin subunit
MFDRTDGRCVAGPARGSGLSPIAITVEDGAVLLAASIEDQA